MNYLYGRGHGIRLLYRGCPLFRESVIRGFTVYCVIITRHDIVTLSVNASVLKLHSIEQYCRACSQSIGYDSTSFNIQPKPLLATCSFHHRYILVHQLVRVQALKYPFPWSMMCVRVSWGNSEVLMGD